MNENIWSTPQGQTAGLNTFIGSPRSWIHRAHNSHSRGIELHETTTKPQEITLAGIFRRGDPLPKTGTWYTLYRFLRMPDDRRLYMGSKSTKGLDDSYSAIGMAIAVPMVDIIQARACLLEYQARWVWWCRPGAVTAYTPEHRQDLDHAKIYEYLDQGMDHLEIARKLRYKIESVKYVQKKWEQGQDINARSARWNKRRVDHMAVLDDIKSGLYSAQQIADRNNTSKTTVYKIASDAGF